MDSKGCTGSFSFTITQPAAALSVVANTSTNVSCFGGNTGAASVTVTGGTAPYTYDWTGTPTGDATASASGLTAGTWVCSVVDAKGCTGSFSFTITQPAAALSVVANTSTNVSCFGGNTGAASVTVTGGTAPYTYDWTGTPTGDATASASGLTAGTWVCSVVDSKGCTGSFSFTITQPAAALSVVANTSTNVSCFGGNTGSASVTVTGGTAPYTYDWTGTPIGDATASASGLTAGTWVCSVVDAKGCTGSFSFTITQPAAALSVVASTSTNVSCFGGNTGAASVTVTGGTAPYTYDWTGTPTGDATASASGLTAGTWVCSVVDSKGCTGSFSFTITQPAAALSVVANASTNVSCFGGNTGSASVTVTGGTAPYTYDWTGTPIGDATASASGLTAGTWVCSVVDAKGCTGSFSFTITQPAAALSVVANTYSNVSCFGGNTGSASVTVTGGTAPYTYDWTGTPTGDATASASGLTAGHWVCSVVDSKGCTGSFSFTITQPAAALSVVANASTNVSCFGGNTGSASVTVTGGTAPYTYDWTGTPTGDATASASGLTAGTWVCSVVDSKGCTGSFSFTITQPAAALSVVANALTNVSCFGGNTGSASVTVTGGTAPYTYDWTGTPTGDATASASGLTAGNLGLFCRGFERLYRFVQLYHYTACGCFIRSCQYFN
ncbi:SprB repeat-containing protein [Flavobacterium sp. 3HN19-14]|uniref:SprB repeat-containing protein n=1 Tax=Flavobacterium sp. 3HN19-14 TaxID=3448133 RepID=UPI003EE05071